MRARLRRRGRGHCARVSDLLEPDVPPDDAERVEELDDADSFARPDEEPGIEGEEHVGLTPPD